jgi:hypothetical protein
MKTIQWQQQLQQQQQQQMQIFSLCLAIKNALTLSIQSIIVVVVVVQQQALLQKQINRSATRKMFHSKHWLFPSILLYSRTVKY